MDLKKIKAMKRPAIIILFTAIMLSPFSGELFSQPAMGMQRIGIDVGGFTNFPANKEYLKKNMSMIYVAPTIRTGKHEFSLGFLYPMQADALYFNEDKIDPRPGIIAGYKFYVFNIYGQENMFIHYSFEYVGFKGNYEVTFTDNGVTRTDSFTEKDMYINNSIGVGYSVFFDTGRRFGLYYLLDYVISQAGYKLNTSGNENWTTKYIWNNLSSHIGLSFKLAPLKKEKESQSR